MYVVTVDRDKCEGCGECVDSCPGSVLEMKDGKAFVVNSDDCLGCETCVSVCPSGAVTLEER
ncbi:MULTISPECIES: ATP-binding protein [Desulfofundulus]|jgi:NAD-dependent dihydropyrimidine dehydrogenase PreA subunit|uniref:Ferredoxin n=1 Tax=Desulfofundulus kuznetsovii (strain DSM 6115 / VKM B-1805 / 17) TaxID=760568 RepID=A0AAU8PZX2_DESK7|nr:4Fe-4S binding protein [Desulfofundulus sp. TPOSR]AEG16974.1 4Fe-4S ferredoxin iron-sulfur binding domain-containing protein [Desulfofundulus kuznetsovii DSM 6115]